jgi:hypothetical protein
LLFGQSLHNIRDRLCKIGNLASREPPVIAFCQTRYRCEDRFDNRPDELLLLAFRERFKIVLAAANLTGIYLLRSRS